MLHITYVIRKVRNNILERPQGVKGDVHHFCASPYRKGDAQQQRITFVRVIIGLFLYSVFPCHRWFQFQLSRSNIDFPAQHASPSWSPRIKNGPLLTPMASPVGGGAGTHFFCRSSLLVFFQIWFFSDISEVVAMMELWNNVSPVYPYLEDVRSGTDKGLVRVGSAKSEGSLQIFVVGVLIRRCCWQSYVVVTSNSSFDLFCNKIWFLHQLPVLVVMDCKSALLGGVPQHMLFQRLLDLITSSEWFFRSSKTCVAMVFASVPFSYCLFSVFFKLR